MSHEQTIPFATVKRQRASRTSTALARRVDAGGNVPKMQPDLAAFCGIQPGRRKRDFGTALYERPYLGEAVSVQWFGRASYQYSFRTPANLQEETRRTDYQSSHIASTGSGAGLYNLVSGQVGGLFASSEGCRVDQQRDRSTDSAPARTAFSDWSDLVREQRPRVRAKKNAIVKLYCNLPRSGSVICFDEMGPLQTIPRGGRSWGKKAGLRPDRYVRNGTLQWFCAFNPHTGLAVGDGEIHKNADTCRHFWEETMLPAWPNGQIHLILDNLSLHKKALRELPWKTKRRLRVYWLPTNSSWLNLIESYFASLQRVALHNSHHRTPDDIENALLKGVRYLNENPRPYKWKQI